MSAEDCVQAVRTLQRNGLMTGTIDSTRLIALDIAGKMLVSYQNMNSGMVITKDTALDNKIAGERMRQEIR